MNLSTALPPVVIPAYQPIEKVLYVAEELSKRGFSIVVVNDGSSPQYDSIFQKLAKLPNLTILKNAVNLGKGAAMKHAFNYILVNYPESLGVVTVDADGQHHPDDVLKVALEFNKKPESFFLGTRKFKSDVPLRSRFGNILTGHIFHFLVGRKLTDTQTGLRAIPRALMEKLLPLRTNRYEFELDMLLIANREKFLFREIPIQTIYEEGNKSSHFNPIKDSIRIYFIFFRFILTSFTAFIIDSIVFTLAFSMTGGMLRSIVIGRFVSLFFVTMASKNFVFHSRQAFLQVFPKMFLLWLFLLTISYGLMFLFVNTFQWNIYASRIVIDSSLFFANFFIQKGLIFYREAEEEN